MKQRPDEGAAPRPTELPELSAEQFAAGLAAAAAPALQPAALAALFAHYQELRRWAPKLDLVGPAFAHEAFERHYGEALAALPLLPPESPGGGRLLDLGSGAGFPGFVLAAVRPDLEVFLLEPRERRWAFLSAALRRAGLGARAVHARVSANPLDLPAEIRDLSIVTVRALKLEKPAWEELGRRLRPGAQLLLWSGQEWAELPPSFLPGRELRLAGAHRYVREAIWSGGAGEAQSAGLLEPMDPMDPMEPSAEVEPGEPGPP